jgi:hypothetical protein
MTAARPAEEAVSIEGADAGGGPGHVSDLFVTLLQLHNPSGQQLAAAAVNESSLQEVGDCAATCEHWVRRHALPTPSTSAHRTPDPIGQAPHAALVTSPTTCTQARGVAWQARALFWCTHVGFCSWRSHLGALCLLTVAASAAD